ALLGRLGLLLELRLIDAWHVGVGFEVDAGDGEALADLVQGDLRRGMDPRRRVARAGQAVRQCHREAARVGRGNQFLGVAPRAALEPGAEAVLPLERAAT